MKVSFAAFIMTYERPQAVLTTIAKLFSQTLPPTKILVVDNSATGNTETVVREMNNPQVSYFKVGYNAGPAGAARIGLHQLANEGFQWIFWGDDDDPPVFNDACEKVIAAATHVNGSVGILGAVGQYFNRSTGETVRVPDGDILENKIIAVDTIAGGQCMIVNADVVKAGILPDQDLFFGFEELAYCLLVKRSGFHLYVSSDLFLRSRQKFGKLNFTRPLYTVKHPGSLKRQYYSTRNLINILLREKLYKACLYQIVKALFKCLYGFRYGFRYGYSNFRYIINGVKHGLAGRLHKYY